MRNIRFLLMAMSVLGLHSLGSAGTHAESVVAQLKSGRRFEAEIGEHSTAEKLVLVFRSGGTTVERPVDWERVVSLHAGDKTLNLDEVRRGAAERHATASVNKTGPVVIRGNADWPKTPPPGQNSSSIADGTAVARHGPIRSLSIDAGLGHWGPGVESTGLVVRVLPLDGAGRITPVSGTLEIEWIGPRKRDFNSAPQSRGVAIERLCAWTATVAPDDFHFDGFSYRAAFGGAHPDFDMALYQRGLVHVRLSVPGEGVFEASQDGIRVRSYAPTRDLLERTSGGRFFPNESTARGKSYASGKVGP